jgi:protocatechuate 3,4-dioxygenase beta subunit
MSRHAIGRRRVLSQLAGGLGYLALPAWLQAPGAYADLLDATARQTPGPFYPDPLPLERDNDLIILGDSLTPASGIITHLRGRILNRSGEPVRNALVEIWQVDANGVYLHPRSGGAARRDPHFQGYGRFETSSSGEYSFRTVRPVPYPGRTPHIHVAVTPPGLQPWTTQCYIRGEPGNARDALFNSIPDARLRESVLVDFLPRAESVTGELDARFDIVLNLKA